MNLPSRSVSLRTIGLFGRLDVKVRELLAQVSIVTVDESAS